MFQDIVEICILNMLPMCAKSINNSIRKIKIPQLRHLRKLLEIEAALIISCLANPNA